MAQSGLVCGLLPACGLVANCQWLAAEAIERPNRPTTVDAIYTQVGGWLGFPKLRPLHGNHLCLVKLSASPLPAVIGRSACRRRRFATHQCCSASPLFFLYVASYAGNRPSVVGGGEPQCGGAPGGTADAPAAVDDRDTAEDLRWSGCALLGHRRRGCGQRSAGCVEEGWCAPISHHRSGDEARVHRRGRSDEARCEVHDSEGAIGGGAGLRTEASVAGRRLHHQCRYVHVRDDPNSFCFSSRTADANHYEMVRWLL